MPTPKGPGKNSSADKAVNASKHGMRWLVGLVLLLAAFLLGYALGAVQVNNSYQQGLTAGWEKARQAVADSDFFPTPETESLRGTVSEVGSDYLKIDVPQAVVNPLEQPAPLTRKVMVDKDTKINELTPLTDDELEDAQERFFALQEEFEEALAAGEAATPPDPSLLEAKSEAIDLSDIEAGMSIIVQAAENIAVSESFTADTIQVQETRQPTDAPPGA